MQNFSTLIVIVTIFLSLHTSSKLRTPNSEAQSDPRYLILFIGDGMGAIHSFATSQYTAQVPPYHSWFQGWVSTYPYEGFYDPFQAWNDFKWVGQNSITDSAAAATALFSGHKTSNGRISVSADGRIRYLTITEEARLLGMAVGAVTSVPISHATPAAWIAHNDSRQNGCAIANEGIWGNPNTTGQTTDPFYGGGHGDTLPPIDVLIGGGHPNWNVNNPYIDNSIREKLILENNQSGKHRFVERVAGSADGGSRLLSIAAETTTNKLVGLFGGVNGNLEYRLADGSGINLENPSLREMALAAIEVLNKNPNGFILLVEGGAIDSAAHNNDMNEMIGELIEFNETIQAVINWVDDPTSSANWNNTLIIVTADHETGYLTRAPNVFADHPLGEVSPRTIQLEKGCLTTCLRASWEDRNSNDEIDPEETVYWAWNSMTHTNQLVPLYLFGALKTPYSNLIKEHDPVRGDYIDNTDIYFLMKTFLLNYDTIFLPLVIR